MAKYTFYIYLLLIALFIQNNIVLVDVLNEQLGLDLSFQIKKIEDNKVEEDSEDSEKEKEKEEKEEKEKEVKHFYERNLSRFNAIQVVKFAAANRVSKIFKPYFETETPPPKV